MDINLEDQQVSEQFGSNNAQQTGEADQMLPPSNEKMYSDSDESELSELQSVFSSADDWQISDSLADLMSKVDYDSNGYSVQSKLPLEVVELIAIHITDDTDLISFSLACKDFAMAVVLDKSTIWRAKFLAKYDFPIIEDTQEFRIAYRLREMVVKKFPSFKDGGSRNRKCKSKITMDVLTDMVLESYHGSDGARHYSKNLDLLSSPARAPYMHEFLSSPFFACGKGAYGKPNRQFAALQVLFSHFLLDPRSEYAKTSDPRYRIRASRDNYHLVIIYLFDKPLELLYQRRSLGVASTEEDWKMTLDLEALLHIRNFWHAHLGANATSMYSVNTMNTYSGMMERMVKLGRATEKWQTPLQKSCSEVASSWFGHYSCTHTRPRKFLDIEEHQTCAQDWLSEFGPDGIHPLNLDIASSYCTGCGWWPPIFATIPILESNVPRREVAGDLVFLRGIAPFLAPSTKPAMYPKFKALRLRGIVHPIPDQGGIPGWRRIVMVFYQPSSRYLLTVLDQNEDDNDDPFSQTEQIPTAQVSVTGEGSNSNESFPSEAQNVATSTTQGPPQQAADQQDDDEALCDIELEKREEVKNTVGPKSLTRDLIMKLEDNLHPPQELAWEDIKWTYVYEGIIIPGGKIMMGRHWRCGPPLMGDAFERGNGADRGPWVFWN